VRPIRCRYSITSRSANTNAYSTSSGAKSWHVGVVQHTRIAPARLIPGGLRGIGSFAHSDFRFWPAKTTRDSRIAKIAWGGGPKALSKNSNRYLKMLPSPHPSWGPYALTLLTKILKVIRSFKPSQRRSPKLPQSPLLTKLTCGYKPKDTATTAPVSGHLKPEAGRSPAIPWPDLGCAYRNADVDQNRVPNNLLVNEPSLSTQGIGGSCGR
jgi:hypothetical protein